MIRQFILETYDRLSDEQKRTNSFLFETLYSYDRHNMLQAYYKPSLSILNQIKNDLNECNDDLLIFTDKYANRLFYSGWNLIIPKDGFVYDVEFSNLNDSKKDVPLYYKYISESSNDYMSYQKFGCFVPDCELHKSISSLQRQACKDVYPEFSLDEPFILINVNIRLMGDLDEGLRISFLQGSIAHEIDHGCLDKIYGLTHSPYGMSRIIDVIPKKLLDDKTKYFISVLSYLMAPEEQGGALANLDTELRNILETKDVRQKSRAYNIIFNVFERIINGQVCNFQTKDYQKAMGAILMRMKISLYAHKIGKLYEVIEQVFKNNEDEVSMYRTTAVLGYLMFDRQMLDVESVKTNTSSVSEDEVREFFAVRNFLEFLKEPYDCDVLEFAKNTLFLYFVNYVKEVMHLVDKYVPLFLDFIHVVPSETSGKFHYEFPRGSEEMSLIEKLHNAEEYYYNELKEAYDRSDGSSMQLLTELSLARQMVDKKHSGVSFEESDFEQMFSRFI